jgi:hypothetical protein
LHTGSDSEYNNITMPPVLGAITGGLYCSGGGNDNTTDSIYAQALGAVASDPTDASTGHVGFVIVDYPTLSTLSFPDLRTVGSEFIIARNPRLASIGFGNLRSVTGNVDITGDFEDLQLPALAVVNGDVNLQTSSASFVCPLFANVSITGVYVCSVGVNDPQPLGADNSSTNPVPIDAVAASGVQGPSSSVSSASVASSVSSSVSGAIVSTSPTKSASGNLPSSSATAGSTKSSASSIRISVISLWIGIAQVLCVFWI